MKNKLLKALKIFIYLIVVLAAFGFIYHFIGGILGSLFADDVITAQNRIGGAYEFLYMVVYGMVLIIALYATKLIKVHILSEENEKKLREIPLKIKSKFSKKN